MNIFQYGPYRANHFVSPDIGLQLSPNHVQVVEANPVEKNGYMVEMRKNDAITAARMILTYYDVDYCSYTPQWNDDVMETEAT